MKALPKKTDAIEWRHGTILKAITCGIRLQISYCVVSEVSVSGIAGREGEVCGSKYEDAVRVESMGNGSVECAKGSCACDIGDSTEVLGFRRDGNVEVKDGDQDI